LIPSISHRTSRCLNPLKGKWDRGPEPTGPIQKSVGLECGQPFIPFAELVNVRPGIPETFCLVLKDNEDPCYAFIAYSYFYNFKNPDWQLPLGKFIVEVEVRCRNSKSSQSSLSKTKEAMFRMSRFQSWTASKKREVAGASPLRN